LKPNGFIAHVNLDGHDFYCSKINPLHYQAQKLFGSILMARSKQLSASESFPALAKAIPSSKRAASFKPFPPAQV